MTANETVLLDIADGIAHITLNRPDSLNSINFELAREFSQIIDSLSNRSDVRVIVLDGAGPHFCAGGDIMTMVSAEDRGATIGNLATAIHSGLSALSVLPIVVITAVRGSVRGAGVGLTLAGDVIVAGESTTFRPAYSGVGLTPDCGLTVLLPHAIGLQKALTVTVLDQVLSAAEAQSLGMIAEVVGDDEVSTRALEIAKTIASGPAQALGETRRLMRASISQPYTASLAAEAVSIAKQGASDESGDRVERFVARSAGGKR